MGLRFSYSRTISLAVFFSKWTAGVEERKSTYECRLTSSLSGGIGSLLPTFDFSECHGLNYASTHSHVEALTPNVAIFGDGDSGR